ncbi:MAG TPA: hypothetical protein DEA22_05240 [Blastocatellia bacterium]|nr:hypothetical protein [Blastocatellia bacterium]
MFEGGELGSRITKMIGYGKIRGLILLIFAGLFVLLALPGGRISAQELIDTTDAGSEVEDEKQ